MSKNIMNSRKNETTNTPVKRFALLYMYDQDIKKDRLILFFRFNIFRFSNHVLKNKIITSSVLNHSFSFDSFILFDDHLNCQTFH